MQGGRRPGASAATPKTPSKSIACRAVIEPAPLTLMFTLALRPSCSGEHKEAAVGDSMIEAAPGFAGGGAPQPLANSAAGQP
jgi:hypothetical protein